MGLFDGICRITFLDYQMICPFTEFSFFLDALDKFQKTVFEFEDQDI